MKGDVVDRMFPFAKRDISEWVQNMIQKKLTGCSYKVCRQLGCLSNTQNYLFSCCLCNWGTQTAVQCVNIFTLEFCGD